VDDNIWEYPFGELDEDEDLLFHDHHSKGDTFKVSPLEANIE
jgi:hypothetical protein